MFNRALLLVIVIILIVLVACIFAASSTHSTEESVLPANVTPTEVVEIVGPYTEVEIVKGFNTTRSSHVSFRSKEALIILRVKQVYNDTETYILYLTCISYKEYKDLLKQGIRWPLETEITIEDSLVEAIRENNVKVLKEVVRNIKEKFEEFKAYVKYTGEPVYLFKLEPGEEIEIPIVLEAPLGKVTKKYLFGIILITPYETDGYSVFGAGGLYIGP